MRKGNIFIIKYSTIYHISIKKRLHIDCLQYGFVVYKHKVVHGKIEVIRPITDSFIPMDLCQNNPPTINFTTDDMTSKFDCFFKEQNKCSISN